MLRITKGVTLAHSVSVLSPSYESSESCYYLKISFSHLHILFLQPFSVKVFQAHDKHKHYGASLILSLFHRPGNTFIPDSV